GTPAGTGGNQAPIVATPASVVSSTATAATLAVLGGDDGGESALTYTWSVTAKPTGAADPTFSVNGNNAAKNTIATFAQTGTYTLLVTITDAGGLSTSSTVNVSAAGANVNLALGKTATSSGDEAGYLAANNAVDGNPGTRWSSQFRDDQYLQVDL